MAKTKSKANAKTSAKKEVAMVVANANGLIPSEQKHADSLIAQCPVIVAAFRQYQEGETLFRSRFFDLVQNLRAPVVINDKDGKSQAARRLTGSEAVVLLRGLGEIKQRVTEWKRVVEMTDEDFAACMKLNLTKLETLQVARGSLLLEEGEDGEIKPVKLAKSTEPSAKATPAAFHKFQSAMQVALAELLDGECFKVLKATNDDVPYEFKYSRQDGTEFLINIFVDRKPVAKS